MKTKSLLITIILVETVLRVFDHLILYLSQNNILPLYSDILNLILVAYGIILIIIHKLKPVKLYNLSVYFLCNFLLYLINSFSISYYNICDMNFFETAIAGTFLDVAVDIFAFILIFKEAKRLKSIKK